MNKQTDHKEKSIIILLLAICLICLWDVSIFSIEKTHYKKELNRRTFVEDNLEELERLSPLGLRSPNKVLTILDTICEGDNYNGSGTFGSGATQVTITHNGAGFMVPATLYSSPFTYTYVSVAADGGNTVTLTLTSNDPVPVVETVELKVLDSAPVIGTGTQQQAPSCNSFQGGVCDGHLRVNGLDPNTDYYIRWSYDPVLNLPTQGLGCGTFTDTVFTTSDANGSAYLGTNLCHGEYNCIEVYTADWCANQTGYGDYLFSTSYEISGSASGTNSSSCVSPNGTIALTGITPTSTTLNLTYTVGSTTVGPTAISVNSSGNYTITGLDEGTYSQFILSNVSDPSCADTLVQSVVITAPSCLPENCSNGIDDDGDGDIDCADIDCAPVITNVNSFDISCPLGSSTGRIIVTASVPTGSVTHRLNGGSWQSSSIFTSLPPGNYTLEVRRLGSNCITTYPSTIVIGDATNCPELCGNGYDDDGDGLTDCEDPDCYLSANYPNGTDTDSDGFVNYCDQDDDNDGITDLDEDGAPFLCTPIVNTSYDFQSLDGNSNPENTISTSGLKVGGANLFFNIDLTGNAAVLNAGINDNHITNDFGVYLGQYSTAVSPSDEIVSEYIFDRLVSDVTFTVHDIDHGDYITVNAYSGSTLINLTASNYAFYAGTVVSFLGNNKFYGGTNDVGNTTGSIDFSIPGTIDKIVVRYYDEITTGTYTFTNLSANAMCYNDYDGDGKINSQDLDSDDDNCPDVLEGGGNFTTSDIANDTLTGGVEQDGIPTVAGSGQTIGTSQNISSSNCNEICNDGVDNDGDGLIDCADTGCQPTISNVIVVQPTCANKTGGEIEIIATGSGTLTYSINNSPIYQASNIFSNLGLGQYIVRVKNDGGCEAEYVNNPIVLDFGICVEICDDGIDNDGDGLVDCNDPDCENVGNATSINN